MATTHRCRVPGRSLSNDTVLSGLAQLPHSLDALVAVARTGRQISDLAAPWHTIIICRRPYEGRLVSAAFIDQVEMQQP